jgi:hypothetical protein
VLGLSTATAVAYGKLGIDLARQQLEIVTGNGAALGAYEER